MKFALVLSSSAVLASTVHGRNATKGTPLWGCGLLGPLPGIKADGSTTTEMQAFIDALKSSSDFDKVHYWNWNLAPMVNADSKEAELLTKDFLFMPEQWGSDEVEAKYVREAGAVDFLDSEGNKCPATMADIFLGMNEPDITGSCMGDMMGACKAPCEAGEEPCPTAHLDGEPGSNHPNEQGHCDCFSDSHATGVGFWPVNTDACNAYSNQPLPHVYKKSPACLSSVVDMWKKTAATAVSKGYKYLTAPLMAVDMDYMRAYVKEACTECQDISCGCPTHVGWHFYASDCRPKSLGGYDDLQNKLDATKKLMEDYPFLKGAIVNEVGMLNCYMEGPASICLPNGPDQKYPANKQKNHACPPSDELPNGLASFLEDVMDMVTSAKTSDGRPVVAAFSWFNEDMAGGTYNLQLFDKDGSVNALGKAYMKKCQAWGSSSIILL